MGTTVAFAIITAVWVAALVGSFAVRSSTGELIGACVIFGGFAAVTVAGWFLTVTSRRQIEVTRDTIMFRKGRKGAPITVSRARGAALRVIPPFRDYSVARPQRLVYLGTGGWMSLTGFQAAAVTRACEAQGWAFGGEPRQAARTAQYWLHTGKPMEAKQLLEMFGPFAVPTDDEPGTSLDAAILEEYGDRISRSARSAARAVYQRAAGVQRAFAGQASSDAEQAARTSVADRIEGRARG